MGVCGKCGFLEKFLKIIKYNIYYKILIHKRAEKQKNLEKTPSKNHRQYIGGFFILFKTPEDKTKILKLGF